LSTTNETRRFRHRRRSRAKLFRHRAGAGIDGVNTRQRRRDGARCSPGASDQDRPDELWGTNATCFWTELDGWCWFFGTIDDGRDEIVG